MKLFLRQSEFSRAILLAYLCALVGGGLHHHDHDGDSPCEISSSRIPCRLARCATQINSSAISSHDDADSCNICTALHQAKALGALVSLAEAFLPVGETVILSIETPHASVILAKQARAPPLA
jgi:hypothetical protein